MRGVGHHGRVKPRDGLGVCEANSNAPVRARRQAAFSLLELVVVVALVVVVTSIALTAYRGHVSTARDAALVNAMRSMSIFQEDAKLRTGAYGSGRYDLAKGDTTLTDSIGWRPRSDDGAVYMVTASVGAGGAASWRVTATSADGRRLCFVFPSGRRCP